MHVLLALDGSPQSLAAARFLTRLPFAGDTRCTVVTALLDSHSDLVNTEQGLELRDAQTPELDGAFAQVQELLSPHFNQVQHVVRRQHPSQLILDVGREENVDLIVVGSVGHSGLYRMTIGSTADYVAHHAGCSTLVARIPDAEPASDAPFQLLVANDGSPAANIACEQMGGIAWPETTEVQVVRMLPRPKLIPDGETYDLPGMQEHEAQLKQQITAKMPGNCRAVVVEAVDIPSGLFTHIKEQQPDLVCVGDTGRSAFARFFLGSTSRYLLHHTDCSIWIARPKSWHTRDNTTLAAETAGRVS